MMTLLTCWVFDRCNYIANYWRNTSQEQKRFKVMMNRMPCKKKNKKSLIESLKSTKDRIDKTRLLYELSFIFAALALILYPVVIVYSFWPSSPNSHASVSTENSTNSSSESFVQSSKHNHVKIYSNRLDSEPVNACDSMVDAAPKTFIVDENSVTGCQDGVLSAKRNGKNVEVYNMTEVREPGDNSSSQEGITLSYCSQWCSLEILVKAAGGTLVDSPDGDGMLLQLSAGTYRFKVVYDDDAVSQSILVRTGKRM